MTMHQVLHPGMMSVLCQKNPQLTSIHHQSQSILRSFLVIGENFYYMVKVAEMPANDRVGRLSETVDRWGERLNCLDICGRIPTYALVHDEAEEKET